MRAAPVLTAVLVALLAGAGWAWSYALSGGAAAAVVGCHAAAGTAIGLVVRVLGRRLRPGATTAAAALTSVLLLVLLPHALSTVALPGFGTAARLGIGVLGAGLAVPISLGAARLSGLAAGVVLLAAGAGALALAPTDPGVLAPHPTRPAHVEDASTARVAVIGIDGGDWRVMGPLIDAGELPNLAALLRRGTGGVLRSMEPMYSPVVWSSIFSGKRPEKHGITGWYVAHAANRRAALLWDVLGSAGLSSVVVNVPGTWPPAAARGALVSGFPIPGLARMDVAEQGQLIGRVVSRHPRTGAVPTALATPDGSGGLRVEVPVGERLAAPRTRLHHAGLEGLLRRRLLEPSVFRVPVRLGPADPTGGGAEHVEVGGHALELARDAWSDWLAEDVDGFPARYRVRRLDGGRLYMTPFFQDPARPRHAFTSAPEVRARVGEGGMYVVEGIGWRAAEDPDLRQALFEHLVQVETQHLDALSALLRAAPDWRLAVHVFTITDRVSHGFWRFHEPGAYPGAPDDAGVNDPERVADAYRWVDRALSRLLQTLGDDTTVLVASDHGFQADPASGWGGHRLEGIYIAAGPGIAAGAPLGELGVLDVTPTILALLGLPAATDMDGRVAGALLADPPPQRLIASYEAAEAAPARVTRIDPTTEEQLRSLGYLE